MNTDKLINFLREKNTRIFASKTPFLKCKIMNLEKASDFDVFDSFCDQLYLFAGHPVRERFLNLLSECLSTNIEPIMLYDAEYRKKLWQKIFFDSSVILPIPESTPQNDTFIVEEKRVFYINSVIQNSFADIYSLLENTLEQIDLQGAEECFFDAKKIEYIRPDDFHAQKSYEKVKNGNNDNSMVALWLLCRVIMNTDLNIVLRVDSVKKAEDILTLIFKLGLSPKLIIDIDISNNFDYLNIYEFLIAHSKKNISLKLSCSKETTDEKDVFDFLKIVPLVFVERTDIKIQTMQNMFNSILKKEETMRVISHLYRVK